MPLLAAIAFGVIAESAFAAPAPPCRASQLSLSTVAGEADAATAQGQSGVLLLLLQNAGSAACSVSPLPQMSLLDADHRMLPVAWVVPGRAHMHPGPVVLPTTLQPGMILRSTLSWPSRPGSSSGGACAAVAAIELQAGQGSVDAPMSVTVCGQIAGTLTVGRTRFAPANATR